MLIFSLHSASNRTANLSWLYLLFKVQRNVNKYSVKSGVQNKTISNRTDCLCAGLFYEFETVAPSENRTICINIHYLAGVCHRNGTAPSNRTIQVDSNRISHTPPPSETENNRHQRWRVWGSMAYAQIGQLFLCKLVIVVIHDRVSLRLIPSIYSLVRRNWHRFQRQATKNNEWLQCLQTKHINTHK